MSQFRMRGYCVDFGATTKLIFKNVKQETGVFCIVVMHGDGTSKGFNFPKGQKDSEQTGQNGLFG